eukprot:Pompholyxophrys_punicea_v1_NODE_243_length_2578_cov_4.304003.p1 type:complete len:731 gc:universal NODE_243_length_2578_cov_4.304003:2318-126(-)
MDKASKTREQNKKRKAAERERIKTKLLKLQKLEEKEQNYETELKFYLDQIEESRVLKRKIVELESRIACDNHELGFLRTEHVKTKQLEEKVSLLESTNIILQDRCVQLEARCRRNYSVECEFDDEDNFEEEIESEEEPTSISPKIGKKISWKDARKKRRREEAKIKREEEEDEADFHCVTLITELIENMNLHDIKVLSLSLYFLLLTNGHLITNSLNAVAKVVDYTANTIRSWRDDYLEDGALNESSQGKFVKVPWMLEDEDLQFKARNWIRENANRTGEPNMTSADFAHYLNEDLLKEVVANRKTKISNTTALKYLNRLGFTSTVIGKTTFIDGHAREDVVNYRQNVFLPTIRELEKRARLWTEDGQFTDFNEVYTKWRNTVPGGGHFHPDKVPGSREAIFVYQDESTGKAGSVQKRMYAEEGKATPARKNEGASFMVSGFAIEQGTGRLSFTREQYEIYLKSLLLPPGVEGPLPQPMPQDADVYIEIGKNKEGYWDNERFIEQMKNAIRIFEYLYPGAEAIFLLDHSGGHTKKPEDGLNASAMNVNPLGKQPIFRNTVWNGRPQVIGNRGLRAVLQERGLYQPGMVQADMVRVLSECEDFKNQITIVEEVLQTFGKLPHRVLWLPKFHAELNCIEMKWAVGKGRARKRCTGKMSTFKAVFQEELRGVNVQEIRRFARKSREWMNAYREIGNLENNANFHKEIQEKVKLYKSHRRVFEKNLNALRQTAI